MDSETVFKLKTLTPLWTGDVDGDSAAARESGLIGSLRFWYEGLLRSMNLDVCDPVEGKRCDGNRFCEACALFGTTGRARRFRFEVDGLQPTELFFRASRFVAEASKNWFCELFGAGEGGFASRALWAEEAFRITIRPCREDSRWNGPVRALVALALSEAVKYGGIGAKTQNGFGQAMLISPTGAELERLIKDARDFLGKSTRTGPPGAGLFTLSEERFFCQLYENISPPEMVDIGEPPAGYAVARQPYIPCAFDIRYKHGPGLGLRPAFEAAFGEIVAQELLYAVKGEPAGASRIHVSHLFREEPRGKYKLKIWGDVPRKDEVKTVISAHILARFHGAEPTSLRG